MKCACGNKIDANTRAAARSGVAGRTRKRREHGKMQKHVPRCIAPMNRCNMNTQLGFQEKRTPVSRDNKNLSHLPKCVSFFPETLARISLKHEKQMRYVDCRQQCRTSDHDQSCVGDTHNSHANKPNSNERQIVRMIRYLERLTSSSRTTLRQGKCERGRPAEACGPGSAAPLIYTHLRHTCPLSREFCACNSRRPSGAKDV